MARPTLPPELRRSHFINVRFTVEEYRRVLAVVERLNNAGSGPRVSPGALIRELVVHELDAKEKREAERRKAAQKVDALLAKRLRS
jgi:hypothetical protein